MNDEEMADALYEAYESGHDDPRSMHYRQLEMEFETDTLPETDAVADAFDLGCDHAQNDVDKFDKDDLLEEMASWGTDE